MISLDPFRYIKQHNKERTERVKRIHRMHQGGGGRIADIPLPVDTLEFIRDYVQFPHIKTKKPVAPLTPLTLGYWNDPRRTCFRLDDKSERLGGADAVGKTRRGKFTSWFIGCIWHWLLMFPELHAVTALQTGQIALVGKLRRRVRYMIQRLPQCWVGPHERYERGQEFALPNGSTWMVTTAGATEKSASSVIRSGDLDIFHGSEAAFWAEPYETWSSIVSTLPENGVRLIESSFSDSIANWHSQQMLDEDESEFFFRYFGYWYNDPDHRRGPDTHEYRKTMDPEWAAEHVPPTELEKEKEYGLDDSQRAFRRWHFQRGKRQSRQKCRREYIEHKTSAFIYGGNKLCDPDALEVLRSHVTAPIDSREAGEIYSYLWARPETIPVIGVDNTEGGRDIRSAVAIDARTLDVLGGCVGKRSLDSDFAAAINWLIQKLGGERYVCVPERNRGRLLKRELMKLGIRIWHEDPKKAAWGIYTGGHNRSVYFDRIREVIDGPELTDTGHVRQRSPIAKVPWDLLVTEIDQLQLVDGRAELVTPENKSGTRGKEGVKATHPELSMAYGIALYVAPMVRVESIFSGLSALRNRPQQGSRSARQPRGMSRQGGPR